MKNSTQTNNPQITIEDEDEELNTPVEAVNNPIHEILPLPIITYKGKTAQPATILTDENNLYNLEERNKQKMLAEEKKQERIKKKISSKITNRKVDSVLLNTASTSASSSIIVSLTEEEWYCTLCEEVRLEDMIQCLKCFKWVHESCARVTKTKKIYYCPQC